MDLKGNIDDNIFEYNPELLLVDSLAKFNTETKDASKYLWSIYFMYSAKSMMYNMEENRRRVYIEKNINGGPLEEDKHREIIDDFLQLITTPAEKDLRYWRKQLVDMDAFSTIWTCSNMKDKVTVLEKRDKFWQALEKAETSFKKELSEGRLKNNVTQSSAETGNIFASWGQ